MAHSGLCCGLYRGTFYLKDLSSASNPLLSVGNAEAEITQELTEIEQASFQSLGGSACKVAYVESVNLNLTLHCTSPENLALAFMGQASQLTETAVVNEAHVVNSKDNELIPFDFVPKKTPAIVVTTTDGLTTYVAGTDYIVTGAGIIIPSTSTIPLASTIHVDYTYGDNWKLDAQTVSQKEFMVVLDGVNVGESGEKAAVLKAWKVKFNPAENFALISGEDFASVELAGEILRDDSKLTGSKYFTVEWAE